MQQNPNHILSLYDIAKWVCFIQTVWITIPFELQRGEVSCWGSSPAPQEGSGQISLHNHLWRSWGDKYHKLTFQNIVVSHSNVNLRNPKTMGRAFLQTRIPHTLITGWLWWRWWGRRSRVRCWGVGLWGCRFRRLRGFRGGGRIGGWGVGGRVGVRFRGWGWIGLGGRGRVGRVSSCGVSRCSIIDCVCSWVHDDFWFNS